MKKLIIGILILMLSSYHVFGQEQVRHLTFVLSIDGEVPIETVTDGYFIISDSSKSIISKIPFTYKVGKLEIEGPAFEKLHSLSRKNSLSIVFYVRDLKTPLKTNEYMSGIWINNDYLIMYIYNKSVKENYRKYIFGKRDYIVRIESSSLNTIQNYRSGWIRKHKCKINPGKPISN